MNKLDTKTRAQILAMLCEGASMRSVSRLTDTSINTVSKLLADAGRFCEGFHDANVRSVSAKRVQVDEAWSFVGAKQKNVAGMKAPVDGAGDVWTWTAIEAETKLLISHFVGGRDGECAMMFMDDLRARLSNRVQLTSDGHRAYLEAVEAAFGGDVDYAQLVKLYGEAPEAFKGLILPRNARALRRQRLRVIQTRRTSRHRMSSASILPCAWPIAASRASPMPFQRNSRITRTWSPFTRFGTIGSASIRA